MKNKCFNKAMKDNTSVLIQGGYDYWKLTHYWSYHFHIKLYNGRLLYNQMRENCYLLYSFKVGGTA